ncbi:NRDE family protein [Proteinivorax hydrogeniformans]|uniref:NRDE family protein n=1 Tax=Proteinivorax hydrogeniformans TaxID=1826727 RepID=A0AAU8HUN8_9FIRM
MIAICTLIFAYKVHPEYDLVFLGNRDEFKNRPTAFSHFWDDHSDILAGIDLLKGGTWTGITKKGRIAFITNYRDFNIQRDPLLSRGYLVKDFLLKNISPFTYLKEVQKEKDKYDLFNLIVGSLDDLCYYSNVENKIKKLTPGLYGLSNALLDTPWPKVVKAKNRLSSLLKIGFSVPQLFEILDDTEIPPDENLPDTGLTLDKERMLSPIHIDTPTYGTRIKTVILINKSGDVKFYEKGLNDNGSWELNKFKFTIY